MALKTPDLYYSTAALLGWWDASAGISGLANGANVASFPDKTAHAYNQVQATGANQPTYNASGGPSGQGALSLNQTWLQASIASGAFNYTASGGGTRLGLTFVSLWRATGAPGFPSGPLTRTNSNQPAPLDAYGTNRIIGNPGAGNTTYSTAKDLGNNAQFTNWNILVQTLDNGFYSEYINGTLDFQTTSPTFGDGTNSLTLGSREDNATRLIGLFVEGYVRVGLPTDADRQYDEGYLAWHSDGTTAGTMVSKLPAGHTYKTAAPSTGGGGSQTATFAATESNDTAAVSATEATKGALAATEAQDTAAIAASSATKGTLAGTEASDTAAIAASTRTTAALAGTEQPDTAAIAASQGGGANLAATEQNDTAAATASTATAASLTATEVPDTASGSATSGASATLAATEQPDTAAVTASTRTSAALSANEAPDTAALTAQQGSNYLAATEQPDTASIAASIRTSAALSSNEASDTAAVSATSGNTAALAATEGQDTAAVAASNRTSGALAATEAPDTAAITGGIPQQAALAATEAADTAAIAAVSGVQSTAALAATEAADTAAISAVQIARPNFVLAARRAGPIRLAANRRGPITLSARRAS